jgi:hypothetical protein
MSSETANAAMNQLVWVFSNVSPTERNGTLANTNASAAIATAGRSTSKMKRRSDCDCVDVDKTVPGRRIAADDTTIVLRESEG